MKQRTILWAILVAVGVLLALEITRAHSAGVALTCGQADLNMDSQVDVTDLVILTQHFGQAAPPGSALAWLDFDQSGYVDIGDIAPWAARFGCVAQSKYSLAGADVLGPAAPGLTASSGKCDWVVWSWLFERTQTQVDTIWGGHAECATATPVHTQCQTHLEQYVNGGWQVVGWGYYRDDPFPRCYSDFIPPDTRRWADWRDRYYTYKVSYCYAVIAQSGLTLLPWHCLEEAFFAQ